MVGYLERLKMKKRQGEVLPKQPKVKKDENMPTGGTAKTAKSPFDSKDSKGGGHISGMIPAPEPPGLGPEYHRIWNQAWTLADWIDDPAAASLAERKAKLPELDRLRGRMADIERQAVPTSRPETETSLSGIWMPWDSTWTSTRDTNPENCPAKCRRTGKCYALAYFKGKPGPAKDCEPETCAHT
jgi:hypothetical protein